MDSSVIFRIFNGITLMISSVVTLTRIVPSLSIQLIIDTVNLDSEAQISSQAIFLISNTVCCPNVVSFVDMVKPK